MNALPDISGNDSQRLQEFVRVTSREVEAVGGASAATTLEMIGYIRELEHATVTRRAAITGPPFKPMCDDPECWVCKRMAEYHVAATSSPTAESDDQLVKAEDQ